MGGPFQYMNGAWSTVEWNVAKGVSDAILGRNLEQFASFATVHELGSSALRKPWEIRRLESRSI